MTLSHTLSVILNFSFIYLFVNEQTVEKQSLLLLLWLLSIEGDPEEHIERGLERTIERDPDNIVNRDPDRTIERDP